VSFTVVEAARGNYVISTDPRRLDLPAIHAYLVRSYWSEGIPAATVARALAGSLCFGLHHAPPGAVPSQVGLARVVTDGATFAYLCDVYVLESHQGHGLGKWLIATVMAHPSLAGLRRFMLGTRDAHGLYARHGFATPRAPDRLMEILRPDIYRSVAPAAPQAPDPA
jgi:GNAT superfamily N-acetyltransferase